MKTLLIEGNYDAVLYIVLVIMFGPAILLTIIGFAVRKKHKKAAKILFIIAAVYLIISLGFCGVLLLG
ncbi:MAG: hypothetical protein R2785_07560 [Flavobacteriaceae bacterium]